jgi:hypothetical protein
MAPPVDLKDGEIPVTGSNDMPNPSNASYDAVAQDLTWHFSTPDGNKSLWRAEISIPADIPKLHCVPKK